MTDHEQVPLDGKYQHRVLYLWHPWLCFSPERLAGCRRIFIIIVQVIQNSTRSPEWLSCPPMGTRKYLSCIKNVLRYVLSTRYHGCKKKNVLLITLTLILLTWTIWRSPTNASKWRMGFNSAFKGLIMKSMAFFLNILALWAIIAWLYCIVLYCGRFSATNVPGCTAAEGLL